MDMLDYQDISERVNSLFEEVSAAVERCERSCLDGSPPPWNEYNHLCGMSHMLLSLSAMCAAHDDVSAAERRRNGHG